MANPFTVNTATSSPLFQMGLGAVTNAISQNRQQQQQMDTRSQVIDLLNQSRSAETPEDQQRLFLDAFSKDPSLVRNYMNEIRANAKVQKPVEYAQGTGELAGYSFDKTTGKYSIDPELKAQLDEKAAKKALTKDKLGAKDIQGINKDFTALIKDASGINRAAKDLAKLNEKSSPTDQLAAIFKFMKSLDPTSVVREGEQQMARSTGGPADYLVGFANQLQGEGSLTPTAFKNMVNTAKNLSDSASDAAMIEGADYLEVYGDTLDQRLKDRLIKRVPDKFNINQKPTTNQESENAAPAGALEYLKANPDAIDFFVEKYGYRPEGF